MNKTKQEAADKLCNAAEAVAESAKIHITTIGGGGVRTDFSSIVPAAEMEQLLTAITDYRKAV